MECEKLAQEKTEMQRHYVMVCHSLFVCLSVCLSVCGVVTVQKWWKWTHYCSVVTCWCTLLGDVQTSQSVTQAAVCSCNQSFIQADVVEVSDGWWTVLLVMLTAAAVCCGCSIMRCHTASTWRCTNRSVCLSVCWSVCVCLSVSVSVSVCVCVCLCMSV